jgi:hypothetical protein
MLPLKMTEDVDGFISSSSHLPFFSRKVQQAFSTFLSRPSLSSFLQVSMLNSHLNASFEDDGGF